MVLPLTKQLLIVLCILPPFLQLERSLPIRLVDRHILVEQPLITFRRVGGKTFLGRTLPYGATHSLTSGHLLVTKEMVAFCIQQRPWKNFRIIVTQNLRAALNCLEGGALVVHPTRLSHPPTQNGLTFVLLVIVLRWDALFPVRSLSREKHYVLTRLLSTGRKATLHFTLTSSHVSNFPTLRRTGIAKYEMLRHNKFHWSHPTPFQSLETLKTTLKTIPVRPVHKNLTPWYAA